ncbi:MAG TPA: peptidylprolyl isomerase, partial [Steroidobacteraceae bacterium]
KLFEEYAQAIARRPLSELTPEDREQIKENLVRVELIAQEAEKNGVAKDPDVITRLDLARLELLQQASAQKYMKEHTPTEAEMRAEFEQQIASAPLIEYQARHILVSSEDVAQKIIAQLKSGSDFAGLAKRMSADKVSAAKGGELGWFGPRDTDPAFTEAVALLKKGEFTKTPVQTSAGWHVIQLQATRDRTPPAYDDVKDRLAKIVVAKAFKSHSDEMLKTAKIEPALTTLPAAAPAPAPAAAPAAPAKP